MRVWLGLGDASAGLGLHHQDASCLGPRAPTQKADKGSRARARGKSRLQASRKRKCHKTPQIAARVARTSARAPEGPKTNGKKSKDRAAREPATAKAKPAEQQPNAQRSSFWRYLQCFVEQGPSIAGMPGSAWRQNA